MPQRPQAGNPWPVERLRIRAFHPYRPMAMAPAMPKTVAHSQASASMIQSCGMSIWKGMEAVQIP